MGRLRFVLWAGTVVVATTAATFAIGLSVGTRPDVYDGADAYRQSPSTDPVAGPPDAPASPGTAPGGAGHDAQPAATGMPSAGSAPAGTGAGTTGPGPQAPGGPSPSSDRPTYILFSSAGSVVASCAGTMASLVSWTPNAGYSAHDPVRGPAAQASVEFRSDTAADILVVVTCPQGSPTLSEQAAGDRGGGPGKGGRDSV